MLGMIDWSGGDGEWVMAEMAEIFEVEVDDLPDSSTAEFKSALKAWASDRCHEAFYALNHPMPEGRGF